MATAMNAQSLVIEQKKEDLSRQEIGYLALMWGLLAINVMVMTFINASFTHCV